MEKKNIKNHIEDAEDQIKNGGKKHIKKDIDLLVNEEKAIGKNGNIIYIYILYYGF